MNDVKLSFDSNPTITLFLNQHKTSHIPTDEQPLGSPPSLQPAQIAKRFRIPPLPPPKMPTPSSENIPLPGPGGDGQHDGLGGGFYTLEPKGILPPPLSSLAAGLILNPQERRGAGGNPHHREGVGSCPLPGLRHPGPPPSPTHPFSLYPYNTWRGQG